MDRTLRIEELLDDAGWLRRLAASLVGDAHADDLVQDTWLAALRRPPRERGAESSPRGWLRTVLANRARNAGRDGARRAAREEHARVEAAVARPDEIAQQAEAQRLLAEAVTRLDEPLRAVIVLRYFRGLESPTVGMRLGLSPSAVRTRLQRALAALREDLDGRVPGGRSSWAALLVPLARGGGAGAPAATVGMTLAAGALAAWPALATAAAACVLVAALALRGGADGRVEAVQPVNGGAALAASAAGSDSPAAALEGPGAPGGRASAEPATAGETEAAGETDAASETETAASMTAVADAVISGVVRVDGRAPEWPVELVLEPHVPVPPPALAKGALPRKSGAPPNVLVVGPEEHGAFAFHDLPRGWRGRVVVRGSALGLGSASVDVVAPRADVALELAAGPAVVGRIFDAEGSPVKVEGTFRVLAVDPDGTTHLHRDELFRSRGDGAFRIGCAAGDEFDRVKLLLAVEDESAGFLLYETPEFAAADGLHAGALVLDPLRALSFTVRDPSGTPLVGALACVDAPSLRRKAPLTGSDGRGVLALVPDRAIDVRFSALGFADRVVRVVPGDEPEVVLEPLAQLELRFLGSVAGAVQRVRISADADPFPWWDGRWDEASVQLGLGGAKLAERRRPEETGGRHELELAVRPGGPVQLVGAEPGLLLTLEALDEHGRVIDSGALALAVAERATLVLGCEDGGGPPPQQTATLPAERRSR